MVPDHWYSVLRGTNRRGTNSKKVSNRMNVRAARLIVATQG